MYSKSDNFPLWKEKNIVQIQNNSCVLFQFLCTYVRLHKGNRRLYLCSSLVFIVACVAKCDLAQTTLEASLNFISFCCSLPSLYALNTLLFLPWTWTEMCSSRATGWFKAPCDLRFLFLWVKPLISCFAKSSLKLVISHFHSPWFVGYIDSRMKLLQTERLNKNQKIYLYHFREE